MRNEEKRNARGTAGARLLLALGAAIGIALAPAFAVTNTVSRPAGFVRITVPDSSEALVSLPFVAFDSDINALFTNQLTGATNQNQADSIRQWDPTSQAYTNAYKADYTGDSAKDGRWFTDFTNWSVSTLGFYVGEGFWIKNLHSSTQTVFLSGTVVMEGQSTVTLPYGFSLFGYPFSSKIDLNDTTLWNDGACGASPVTNADAVSDLIGGDYAQAWLLDDTNSSNHGKWVDASTNLSDTALLVGRGYWYQRILTNSFDWQETRPYANYFPTNDNPPYVSSMTFNSNKDEVTLFIATTGEAGEKIDIYYQDLSQSNGFTSLGWDMAVLNLSPGGSSISWTDTGSGGRGKIDTVYARCYLVGRADIDSDGDGVPDSRETFIYGSNPNSNDLTVLPFIENFETNTVQVGDINGQNKWIASSAGAAMVQTGAVYQGGQALRIDTGTNGAATVRHDFVPDGEQDIVWVDFYAQVKSAAAPTNLADTSAAFYFGGNGELVVYDGLVPEWQALTNQAAKGSWARISLKMDYSRQKWSVCLNGQDAASDLGFANSNTEGFSRVTVEGRQVLADAFHVTTNAPADLMVDWDALPNSWELAYFGNLDQPEAGDPDGDGLTNLQEYQLGTDPTVDDRIADDDGDNLSNYEELMVYGTDPHVADSDGDGANDGYEVNTLGTDPAVADQGDTGGPTVTILHPAAGEKVLW